MDVSKILEELKAKRHQIEEAVLALERLVGSRGRRRGRPPGWMSEITVRHRGRPPFTPKDPNLPPAAAMRLPLPVRDFVWAGAGRKQAS